MHNCESVSPEVALDAETAEDTGRAKDEGSMSFWRIGKSPIPGESGNFREFRISQWDPNKRRFRLLHLGDAEAGTPHT